MDNEKIDFVLYWVDDQDPGWQKSYNHFSQIETGESHMIRFRDWGTLKYWFRGVDLYAPWVNKVFFITCGHYPSWLNLNHPKLKFIKHSDYIPSDFLPTFNSHTIELNLHRIPDLGQKFIIFNDDTFIIHHLKPDRFFKNGIPRDIAVLNAPQPVGDTMDHIICNDIAFTNKYFNKSNVLKKNFSKWLNLKYGVYLIRTILLAPYPKFTGFVDPHLPNPYLKSNLDEVWRLDPDQLFNTCKCKFRNINNINQYVFRYYQLIKGQFYPINPFNTSITYSSLNDKQLLQVINDIKNQRKPLICINDGDISDFEKAKKMMMDAFNAILPDKSSFEI